MGGGEQTLKLLFQHSRWLLPPRLPAAHLTHPHGMLHLAAASGDLGDPPLPRLSCPCCSDHGLQASSVRSAAEAGPPFAQRSTV